MRVTDNEVKKILDTTVETTPFIATASLIVDETLADQGLTDARLKQIELYLSAHLACTMDPRLTQESVGDASNTYQTAPAGGKGLDATTYGQHVKMLDTTGLLANLEKPKATIETLRTQIVPRYIL